MKNSIFILSCLFFHQSAKSQDTIAKIDSIHYAKNALYVELLGSNCTPLSLHYSRIIKTNTSSYFDLESGIGYYPHIYFSKTNPVFGVSTSFNWNTRFYKKHHMHYGVGLAYSDGLFQYGFSDDRKESLKALFGSLRIGYKYQKFKEGLYFQLNATPIFKLKELYYSNTDWHWASAFPLVGLGVGYSW